MSRWPAKRHVQWMPALVALIAATAAHAQSRPMAALQEVDLIVEDCRRQGNDIICRARLVNISERDVRVGIVPTSAIGSLTGKSYAIVSGNSCGWNGNRATFGGRNGTTGQTTIDLFVQVPVPIVVMLEGCSQSAKSVDVLQLMLNTRAGFEPLVRRQIVVD